MTSIKSMPRKTTAARQRGQGMSEYIIIVALIAVGAIGVFSAFGGTIRHQVAGMAQELSGKTGATETAAAQTSAGLATTSAAKVKDMGTYATANK